MGAGGSLSTEIQDMVYSQRISQSDHFKVSFNGSQPSNDSLFPWEENPRPLKALCDLRLFLPPWAPSCFSPSLFFLSSHTGLLPLPYAIDIPDINSHTIVYIGSLTLSISLSSSLNFMWLIPHFIQLSAQYNIPERASLTALWKNKRPHTLHSPSSYPALSCFTVLSLPEITLQIFIKYLLPVFSTWIWTLWGKRLSLSHLHQ